MEQNNGILQGALMEQHRRIINEIADIKVEKFELTEEDRQKISKLELQLKEIAQRLYVLYNK
jgi:hypothetical protein